MRQVRAATVAMDLERRGYDPKVGRAGRQGVVVVVCGGGGVRGRGGEEREMRGAEGGQGRRQGGREGGEERGLSPRAEGTKGAGVLRAGCRRAEGTGRPCLWCCLPTYLGGSDGWKVHEAGGGNMRLRRYMVMPPP